LEVIGGALGDGAEGDGSLGVFGDTGWEGEDEVGGGSGIRDFKGGFLVLDGGALGYVGVDDAKEGELDGGADGDGAGCGEEDIAIGLRGRGNCCGDPVDGKRQ